MTTEEEARKSWCPFARQVFQFREGDRDAMLVANRAEADYPLGDCIASDCMAWRWDTELNDQLLADARIEFGESEDPRPLKDTPIYPDFFKSRHGYCGLAGKP